MCGIIGAVSLDGAPMDVASIDAANRLLGHRGPDGGGIFQQENVCLAHRRLAIIDPRLGQQPFVSADSKLALSYNGEVYNFIELRKQLEADCDFVTDSDTEVVLKSYQAWGMRCLERFRGMFAFAIYDAEKGKLFLARDRVGIKPLYYCRFGSRFAFASELAALIALPWVHREIDREAVAQYFRYSYIPTPATIYKGILKLEPGHYLSLDTKTGVMSCHRYWQLSVAAREGAEDVRLERLNALLDETIKLYSRSDVAFGCFLSGGVDSSLVAALMGRMLPTPVRTFTIGFREAQHSELPFATEASRIVGSEHYERVVAPELADEFLSRLARHFGEPFADSSAIPTYFVSQMAAQHVKMVLSGDGGDELFGGYNSYRDAFAVLTDPLHPAKRFVARALMRFMAGEQLRGLGSGRARSLRELQDAQRFIFADQELQELLVAPDVPRPLRFPLPESAVDRDPIACFQYEDFNSYLPDDVLTKVDRMSMANSLEVRVPLLDHELVEFAFALPLSLRLRGDLRSDRVDTKYLLKQSAVRFYPRQFLDRPKQGFGIPIVEWCIGPLRQLILERLTNRKSELFDWVRYDKVGSLLAPMIGGRGQHIAKVWALLMFDLWLTAVHRQRSL